MSDMCLCDKLREIDCNWLGLSDIDKFRQLLELSRIVCREDKSDEFTPEGLGGIMRKYISEEVCVDMILLAKQIRIFP